jgi:hypothetical protein
LSRSIWAKLVSVSDLSVAESAISIIEGTRMRARDKRGERSPNLINDDLIHVLHHDFVTISASINSTRRQEYCRLHLSIHRDTLLNKKDTRKFRRSHLLFIYGPSPTGPDQQDCVENPLDIPHISSSTPRFSKERLEVDNNETGETKCLPQCPFRNPRQLEIL